MYVGKVNDVAGLVTVAPNSYSYEYGATVNQSIISGYSSVATDALSLVTLPPGNVYAARLDSTTTSLVTDSKSVTYRSEVPITARIQNVTGQHSFQPMYASRVVCVDTNTYFNSFISIGNQTPVWLGIVGIDTNYGTTDLQLSGLSVNTQYRIEVAMCIEYIPMKGTAFTALSRRAAKVPISKLIVADDVLSSLPVSTPTSTAVDKVAEQNLANQLKAQAQDLLNTATSKPVTR